MSSLVKIKNIHGGTLDALGEAIVRGDYPQGTKLPPENDLCESMGVSRTSIRETVKSLVAKGLITTGPKVGTIVLPPERWNLFDDRVVEWQAKAGFSIELLRDLQELRAVIEPQAVRLAATRASESEIDEIEKSYKGMVKAVAANSSENYIHFDYEFHFGLLRASHNQMFLQIGRILRGLLNETFRITTLTPDAGIARSLPHHFAILKAIRSRNPELAYAKSVSQIVLSRDDTENIMSMPSAKKKIKKIKLDA